MNKRFLQVRSLFAMALMAFSLLSFTACSNPFDPLHQSSRIDGLSYIDWSGSWERWDSDPEYDGFVITMEYLNRFGDSLEFRDKGHNIKIEFYTQITAGPVDDSYTTHGSLLYSQTVNFSNTNNDIYIAKELYEGSLPSTVKDGTDKVYVLIHVYPPDAYPQAELKVGYPDQIVFASETGDTPNQ